MKSKSLITRHWPTSSFLKKPKEKSSVRSPLIEKRRCNIPSGGKYSERRETYSSKECSN